MRIPLQSCPESISFLKPVSDYVSFQQKSDGVAGGIQVEEMMRQLAVDLQKLDALRRECQVLDAHANYANLLIKYHSWIESLGGKVPINEGHVRIPFQWISAFAGRGGIKSKAHTFYDLKLESACALYNAAAVFNNVGLDTLGQASGDPETVKQAAQSFQLSAGVFKKLSDEYSTICGNGPFIELSPKNLAAMQQLNLALAQQCFYVKSCMDQLREGKMKDSTISKLAYSCSELFRESAEIISADGALKTVYQKSGLLSAIQSKSYLFNAAAEFRKSKECLSLSKYGEEVARLRLAESLFKKVDSQQITAEWKALQSEISVRLKQAEKENDVIYLDPVPSVPSALEKAQLAQCAPFPTDSSTAKIFTMLYPPIVSEYKLSYEKQKGKIVEEVINSVKSCITSLDGCLTETGLPGSIQAVEEPRGIPAEIITKSKEVSSNGGSQSVVENRQTLRVLSQDAQSALQRIEKALDDELNEDRQCRLQFADRWRRSESILLQKNLREQLAKFKGMYQLALSGDKIIDDKVDKYLPSITALSSQQDDLVAMIPTSMATHQFSPVTINSLKQLLKNSEVLRKEFGNLSNDVKKFANEDNIANELLSALNANGNMKSVIAEHLKKYEIFKQRQEILKNELGPIISDIRSTNAVFRQELSQTAFQNHRETAIQSLSEGYLAFKSLQENFSEGIKFYDGFNRMVQQLLAQTQDYCFARSTEKRDLLQDFAMTAANSFPTGSPPVLPPRPNAYP